MVSDTTLSDIYILHSDKHWTLGEVTGVKVNLADLGEARDQFLDLQFTEGLKRLESFVERENLLCAAQLQLREIVPTREPGMFIRKDGSSGHLFRCTAVQVTFDQLYGAPGMCRCVAAIRKGSCRFPATVLWAPARRSPTSGLEKKVLSQNRGWVLVGAVFRETNPPMIGNVSGLQAVMGSTPTITNDLPALRDEGLYKNSLLAGLQQAITYQDYHTPMRTAIFLLACSNTPECSQVIRASPGSYLASDPFHPPFFGFWDKLETELESISQVYSVAV